jgi:hypothetical protein
MRKSVKAALTRWHGSPVTEQKLQVAIVKLLHVLENQGRLRFFHVPNGGSRHVVEAVNLKKQGVRKGVPDLVIVLPNGRTLFWELKSPKGDIRREQRDWAQYLTDSGFHHRFIRSFEQAETALREELLPLREAA